MYRKKENTMYKKLKEKGSKAETESKTTAYPYASL
jgi:hypothetical protein